jgi:undecaprenyl-diphosphatase
MNWVAALLVHRWAGRPLARVALICAVALIALTIWVVVAEPLPGERRALIELRDALGSSLDDEFIAVRDATDTWPLVGAAAAIVVFTAAARRRFDALFFAAGFVLTVTVNPLLKEWVGRARPALAPRLVSTSKFSFPSGHAANTAALAIGIVMLVPSRHRTVARTLGAVGLVAVAVSQLGLGVHYPSDIVAGWLLAGACTAAVWSVRGRRRRPRSNRMRRPRVR